MTVERRRHPRVHVDVVVQITAEGQDITGRLHDTRHTLVTELAESGAGDQTIMDIAGHVAHPVLWTLPGTSPARCFPGTATSAWKPGARPWCT